MNDDVPRLLRRAESLDAWLDRHTYGRTRPGKIHVGYVYSGGSFPTSAGRYHLTRPVAVSGTESEGSTPTLTVDSASSVPVLVLDGPMSVGDYLVADAVDGRWVSTKGLGSGGGGTGTLLGCVCRTPPDTLYLHVTNPIAGFLEDATIVYGPTPAPLAPLLLGTNSYLSSSTYADAWTGEDFRFYLSCFGSVVRLSRVFESTILTGGGPFLDSVIYFWTIGFTGNTCTPFSLTNGSIFAGGSLSTTAILDGTP